MTLFFRPNPQDPTFNRATRLTKALSIICTAGMLNVMTLPAQAAAANDKAKAAFDAKQSLVGNDAYDQLVNITSKYQLEQESYQQHRQETLAGRSIYKKTVDGITSLFTDDSEVIETIDPQILMDAKSQLLSLQERLDEEQLSLIAQLSAQTKHMQQGGFTRQDFLDHRDLIVEMGARHQTLDNLFAQLRQSTTESQSAQVIATINTQLQEWQPKQQQTDVENLPWGMPDSEVREPIVSEADAAILQNANYDADRQPFSAVHQWRDTEYRFGQMLLNQTTSNTDFNKVAGLAGQTDAGNWTVLNALPTQVGPADLTETPDIQITQAIRDKASELNNNPAEIYKWVHDTIQYVPTYGSIQGSDYTLQTKRGNAFDTASLLIALLRASDIPARYVYGTVDIPAKQAMDWVGGVNNISAAQNLLGQGGVPNVAMTSGSVATHLRMEHVWVEANINAISRGAANNDNQTQWIPLDASYKSYIRTEGIDLTEAVPFDAEALIEQAKAGAIIDEAAGSVSNLNQGAVNQAIEDYQAQVETYIEQNHSDATVGDVLGTSTIKPYNSTMLSPVLPYQVKTVVSDYQELPDSMRHYFTMVLYENMGLYGGYAGLSSPALNFKIATTQLQGKPLALSFKPASQADEDRLLSYLPKDDTGTLPSSLPTSINMTPEITLNGEVLVTGSNYKLGDSISGKMDITSPGRSSNGGTDKEIIAGEYHAIGYDLQGLSQQQLENTKNTLETAKEKLEQFEQTENQASLDGLTKHDLTGAILQAGVQSYYAVNDTQDIIAQKQAGIVQYPYLTYGTFSTNLTPEYRYGIPFNVKLGGVVMDIDRILHTKVEVNNDREKLTAYNLSRGPSYSLNENLVPEQLFDDPETEEKEADGISATKALSLAAQQGQTIYTITKANYAEVLPKLTHSDVVMTDIRNGVNAGKTITVHDTQIRFYGWLGTGYTILDPNSGAGAYMIGGGLDGGFSDFISSVTGWLTLTLTTLADATAGFIHRVISLGFYAVTATINFVTSIITNAFLMFRDCDPVTAAILMIPIICATAIFSVLALVTSIFLVGILISIIGALVVGYMSSQFREIACRVN